ncbi:MAG: hypothetical protein KDB27_22200 [Planctomycetales bacterium]|nr:hypothetical protein [Planctomycetales bacterium]
MKRSRNILLSMIVCVVCVNATLANPYAKIAVKDTKTMSTMRSAARKAKRSASTAAERKPIRDYVLKCGIAPIATPENYATDGKQLATFRENILDMIDQSPSQTHAEIVSLCEKHFIGSRRDKLPGIANSDSFSPPARLNAMLVIAELNETEATRTQRVPKPSSMAGQYMTYVVGSNKYPQYLRIAALNGLRRHAACGAVKSKRTLDAVLQILKEDAGPGMTDEALVWQRRLAIETLGLMKAPALEKEITPYLTNKDAPLELRCAAAEALGRLKYAATTKAQAESAIAPVGALAVVACAKQVDRITAELALEEKEGQVLQVPRGPGEEDAPAHPIVQKTRRILLTQLECVETGVAGLSEVATGDSKTLATGIATHLGELKALLEGAKSMQPQDLRQQIATTANKIDQIVANR